MTDKYNAQIHLLKLKKQSKAMQRLLLQNYYDEYVKVNNKLKNCSDDSIVIDNRINQQLQSCDSPFCPICASAHRIRKECAIAYGVFDEINQGIMLENGRICNPCLSFLTLTVPKVPIDEFEDTFKKIRSDFKVFLEFQMEKKLGKWVSFDQSLLGHSVYYHLSLKNDYAGNPVVGVHLHAILLLKPSIKGINSITSDMITDGWSEVVGQQKKLQTNITSISLTHTDFIRTVAYGLAKWDFDEAIANPNKFIELIPYIKGKRFQSHTGEIAKLRTKVQKYHKSKQNFYKAKTILTTMHNIKDTFYVVS